MNIVTASPMPPEKAAYALARYSRSADSFKESLSWVCNSGQDFLEKFYFGYGHASVADLGHTIMCFEGISEIAAVEIEDEQLWDGQAKSTRFQNFSNIEPVVPAEFTAEEQTSYRAVFAKLLAAYNMVSAAAVEKLHEDLPYQFAPAGMSLATYNRTISARAFDVARYLLPMGIPTNVCQVTSIRTLEKQIRRLGASPFAELREVAAKMKAACAEPPGIQYQVVATGMAPPMSDFTSPAPSLAKHCEPSEFELYRRRDLQAWYEGIVGLRWGLEPKPANFNGVKLHMPMTGASEILATLLYPGSQEPYRSTLSFVKSVQWPDVRAGLLAAVAHRGPHDELPREFRDQAYTFEIVCDLGAYRDLHRHRRCQQIRQDYTIMHGYETPELIEAAGCKDLYDDAIGEAHALFSMLGSTPAAAYILPFATRVRFLMKMDFAEAEYICKLRSGVKGHPSYRLIAWQMFEEMKVLNSSLAWMMQATPPTVKDDLRR